MRHFAYMAIVVWFWGCAAKQAKPTAPHAQRSSPVALEKLARAHFAAQDPRSKAQAIDLLKAAVQSDATLWEARFNLGVLWAEQNQLAAAEEQLKIAYQMAPDAEDVALALADVYRRRGNVEGGLLVLQDFLSRNPGAEAASLAQIRALRQAAQIPRAITLTQALLLRNSKDAEALSELALLHLERGELDTAELIVGEALKTAANTATTERTAGLIALRKGDDAAAFRHFARATELNPRDTTARLNVGTVYLQAGVYDRAAEEFRAVLSVAPESKSGLLGFAAARRGQASKQDPRGYSDAENALKTLLSQDPDHLAATFNLAILYADYLSKPGEAAALFRKFLRDAPANHPARDEALKREQKTAAAPPKPGA